MPRTQRLFGAALLLLIILLAVGRSALGTRLDGFTVDEPWHVVAGTIYDRTGDFRLNPEQPPLAKVWVGAWMPRSFRTPAPPVLHEKGAEREFVEDAMFRDNDAVAAHARTRLAMWTFHALLLLAIGGLLWRAFGLPWALGTLAFVALEPSVSAHLPVAMMDLPLAMGLTIAALAGGLWLATWRWRWATAFGIGIGLALGAKHSALAALLGLFALTLVAALWPLRDAPARIKRLGQGAAAWLLGAALLWAMYGLRFHAAPDGSDPFNMPMADKIAGLHVDGPRRMLALADELHVLPRAYLWGLADTVRAGVEGRGQSSHRLWGHLYQGAPPWFTWPSFVVSKIPLPLLALSLLGSFALWRLPLSRSARGALLAMAVMCGTHLLALATSQGTYAGVRHALPLVFGLAVLAGALAARIAVPFRDATGNQRLPRASRTWSALLAAGLLATAAMTLREPRLWEYHNELAGGTDGGWRQFSNEGVDLGQRFDEVANYYRTTMRRTGEPLYYDYWMIRAQAKAAGVPLQRRAVDLHDDNVAGRYTGWFVVSRPVHTPVPERDWDPALYFRGLKQVAHFGQAEIWHGTQVLPKMRADGLFGRIIEYVYQQDGKDAALVARRAEEIVKEIPYHMGAAIELGNARLRLGDARGARAAYQQPLDLPNSPVDAITRKSLEERIAQLDAGVPAARVAPLRNPWME